MLQGTQDLIAEPVAKGYRIVYTDGSSKRLSHKDMRRAGGFGVFAVEDEQGPEVRSYGYVPTRHRETNNGAELWAALEALHLGVTSCPPSRTPYTRHLIIFYISTLSMLFDVCDRSCWQSCVTPVEIRVDVLALCTPVF